MPMKSSSITIATMRPSLTTGKHPMRCRRIKAIASSVQVSGDTVTRSRRMTSATETNGGGGGGPFDGIFVTSVVEAYDGSEGVEA